MALLHIIIATEFNNRTLTHHEWQIKMFRTAPFAAGILYTNMFANMFTH